VRCNDDPGHDVAVPRRNVLVKPDFEAKFVVYDFSRVVPTCKNKVDKEINLF
jgi:hypothetical protein